MTENPFRFLLGLTETQGKAWLRRYLKGENTDPSVRIPFDLQPLEFLLGRISPLPDPVFPLRIGTLAGELLAEAIIRGPHRAGDPREVEVLFTLVESLPVSREIAEFLNDLAVTGRLLTSRGETGRDLHFLTLRALVLHQRPLQGEIEGLLEFWKRKLKDPRYAPIAIQGLLRISVPSALECLPEFVSRARASIPPIPLANTLFAVSMELGADQSLWADLVRAFEGDRDGFEVLRETFRQTRLPELNPDAWAALHTAPRQPPVLTPFASRYLPQNDPHIESARHRLKQGRLLEPSERLAA